MANLLFQKNFASWLSRQGENVLLIDADPQTTSSNWASLRQVQDFQAIAISNENMAYEIAELKFEYDHIVIDGPPRAERIARSIIIASDLIVIPIEPSAASIWAAGDTIEQIAQAQRVKEKLNSVFLVTRKIANTVLGRDITAMAQDLEIPVLANAVHQRIAFAEALSLGKTIFEWAPNSAAVRDIEKISTEIMEVYAQKDVSKYADTETT